MAKEHIDDAGHPDGVKDASSGHSIGKQGTKSQGADHANAHAAFGQSMAAWAKSGRSGARPTKS